MASIVGKLTVGAGLVAATLFAVGSQALAKGPGHASHANVAPVKGVATTGTKTIKIPTKPVTICTTCKSTLPPKTQPPKPPPHVRHRFYGGGVVVVSAGYCVAQAERCAGLYGT